MSDTDTHDDGELREDVVAELENYLGRNEGVMDEMMLEFSKHPTDAERAEAHRRYIASVVKEVDDNMPAPSDFHE